MSTPNATSQKGYKPTSVLLPKATREYITDQAAKDNRSLSFICVELIQEAITARSEGSQTLEQHSA
jgi:hypothetical protein